MSLETRDHIRSKIRAGSRFDSYLFVGVELDRKHIHIIGREVSSLEVRKIAENLLNYAGDMEDDKR